MTTPGGGDPGQHVHPGSEPPPTAGGQVLGGPEGEGSAGYGALGAGRGGQFLHPQADAPTMISGGIRMVGPPTPWPWPWPDHELLSSMADDARSAGPGGAQPATDPAGPAAAGNPPRRRRKRRKR